MLHIYMDYQGIRIDSRGKILMAIIIGIAVSVMTREVRVLESSLIQEIFWAVPLIVAYTFE